MSVVETFPLSRIRLLPGPFKERQDIHARYLLQVEADRLLAPFHEQAELPAKAKPYGGWEARDIRGHSLGHYLSALALMFAATGDDAFRHRIDYIVQELERCQRANGDGYVLPVEKRALEQLRDGVVEASGFGLNGVWVPFYTLHKIFAGLRDAYRHAKNTRALEIAQRLGDWLEGILCNLDATQVQRMLACEHGGMNEVLADLAVDTGDARCLTMASKYFHHDAVLEPMMQGDDQLDGLHANTQIPKVIGVAREWELTGEPRYRLAAKSFWNNVVKHRSFCNGGNSESEHFFPPAQFPRRLTPFDCETCNTYNMLKLTSHLFRWEPKAEHMDYVERALINHLLVNIGRAEGEFGYFLNLGAVGVKVFSTPFDSWWCCVGTGLENPGRYGEQVYSHNEESLWINLFMGSTLDWHERGVMVRQETCLPDENSVRFSFACKAPTQLALKLRHPYWCDQLEIRFNGEAIEVNSMPSSYFSIEREWQDGDTLELRLPMALRLEPLPYSDGKIAALMYGPMVLAALVPEEGAHREKQRYSDHLSARGKTDAFPPLFVARDADELIASLRLTEKSGTFHSKGTVKPRDLTFVPFHHIYEEQYAVYLPLLTADEWTSREAEIHEARERELRREAATIDSITPGYQQPEVEHHVQGINSSIGDFQDRKFRATDSSHEQDGWFSYEMAVDSSRDMALVATYWGAEWGAYRFDILVEGERIATQRLHADRPGDFFDVAYSIPAELTQGKATITVRFQSAVPGARVGRLFGLRMMSAPDADVALTNGSE